MFFTLAYFGSAHPKLSIVCFCGGGIYLLVASGNKQPWAEEKMSPRDQLRFEMKQIMFK